MLSRDTQETVVLGREDKVEAAWRTALSGVDNRRGGKMRDWMCEVCLGSILYSFVEVARANVCTLEGGLAPEDDTRRETSMK